VHPATLRLAARVAALAPDPASRVFFTSGGSEAVETAMKMAKKFHRSRGDAGRYKFISRRGSYHGATHGCLSLGGGGGNNGADYGPLPYGGVRVQGPDQYRNPFGGTDGRGDIECAREIEAADMGGYLFGRLQELYRYDIVGQVRGGLGLICAVEIVADRATREPFPKQARLAQRAGLLMERHGLLGRSGNIIFVAPPLCVTRGELDFLVRQLAAVIAELQADLLARGRAA
jgi:adenosylmethionine-8-amino-7-oxononanoate aminotransferase